MMEKGQTLSETRGGHRRHFICLLAYPLAALFCLAHRARCAAEILARASGDMVRFLGPGFLRLPTRRLAAADFPLLAATAGFASLPVSWDNRSVAVSRI